MRETDKWERDQEEPEHWLRAGWDVVRIGDKWGALEYVTGIAHGPFLSARAAMDWSDEMDKAEVESRE